jgi:hypothetical protein
LPNEFLQNDELSVDTIVKIFSKTLHVSAPSLPRHNYSTDLPSELPAELLYAPLIWVHRGGVVPPLQLMSVNQLVLSYLLLCLLPQDPEKIKNLWLFS